MRAPRHKLDYLTVIQRSSTATTLTGIDHPSDLTLKLDKDGRWVLSYQRAAQRGPISVQALANTDKRGAP